MILKRCAIGNILLVPLIVIVYNDGILVMFNRNRIIVFKIKKFTSPANSRIHLNIHWELPSLETQPTAIINYNIFNHF